MRYLRLFGVSFRMSVTTAMTYRVEFVVGGLISLWWLVWALVPLGVVFGATNGVAGWSFPEAMLVVAWFTALRGLLEGMIAPSLQALVEGIRSGTLDFVLLKPADAQFLVSTAKFEVWRLIDVAAAAGIIAWAFARMGRAPEPHHTALALALIGAGALVLYSVWILVVSAAFWVVRLDNLTYLFNSILDFARWPVSVFKGAFRVVFTLVIPLALMTTYPAEALLGRIEARTAALSIAGALAFALASRLLWTRAIGRYTSASS